MPEQAEALTDADVARVHAARAFVHAANCPRDRQHQQSCPACPNPYGTHAALRVLDANPRDARGARRALHDAACMSSCPADDNDHADRTQSKPAAALRRFHAQEAPRA